MKFLNQHILLINILFYIRIIYGFSSDCKDLNEFLNKGDGFNFCKYTDDVDCNCEDDDYHFKSLIIFNYEAHGEESFKKNFKTFPLFPKLKELKLTGLKEEVLPNRIFDLPNLETITIDSGNVATIPDNINLKSNIKKIDLSNNMINKFPDVFFKLPKINKLILKKNNIKELPKDIYTKANLDSLDLSYNRIKEIPKEYFNSLNIKKMDLNNNQLSKLPDGINTSIKMEYLDISNNSFEEFPKIIFDFKNLKQIIFNGNKNTIKLPNSINTKSPLEIIELNLNGIQKFPYYFSELKNLKELSLNRNNITGNFDNTYFKNGFSSLENFSVFENALSGELIIPWNATYINVYNNKFSSLSLMNNANYSSLNTLYLRHNNFSDDIFTSILKYKNLLILDLSENPKIENIPQEISDLSLLTSLIISNTGIKSLPSNIFKLSNLSEFDISHNHNLKTKIIHFNNFTLDFCYFIDVYLSCYQPQTCNTLLNNEGYNEDIYADCDDIEINEIIQSQIKTDYEIQMELRIEFERQHLATDSPNEGSIKIISLYKLFKLFIITFIIASILF